MSFQDEDALRALVRETIARRLGSQQAGNASPVISPTALRAHASHYRYALTESDGPCLIEPGVQCNHCGYCQSHGH